MRLLRARRIRSEYSKQMAQVVDGRTEKKRRRMCVEDDGDKRENATSAAAEHAV